jgi:hypothetical protein
MVPREENARHAGKALIYMVMQIAGKPNRLENRRPPPSHLTDPSNPVGARTIGTMPTDRTTRRERCGWANRRIRGKELRVPSKITRCRPSNSSVYAVEVPAKVRKC